MRKVRGKGIYIEHKDFHVHRNTEMGYDFWDPDFQVVLRSIEDCAHFFPLATRPEGKDGHVLFSMGEGRDELLSRSHHLKTRRLPQGEVERFIKAMDGLREKAGNDPRRMRSFELIRLPDPNSQQECYRLYGPFWHRQLAILWGFDYLDKQGNTLSNLNVEECKQRLKSFVDPMYTFKVALELFLHLVVFVMFCGLLVLGYKFVRAEYDQYRAELARIPRCMYCREELVNGICSNFCINCGIHKKIWKKEKKKGRQLQSCHRCAPVIAINRDDILHIAPVGVLDVKEGVRIAASKAGTFSSAGWPDRHVAPGDLVFYRWSAPGNYSIRWQPDVPGGSVKPLNIPIYVRCDMGMVSRSTLCASFLLERVFDDTGNLSEVVIKDCSYDDLPEKPFYRAEIKWADDAEFMPLDEVTKRKTMRQLWNGTETQRSVTLRVTGQNGITDEMTRILTPEMPYPYPEKGDGKAELHPSEAVVGETVLCTNTVYCFKDSEHAVMDWGTGEDKAKRVFKGYHSFAYSRPGRYKVTATGSEPEERMEAEIEVYDPENAGQRLMDLNPPSIKLGDEVVASDVSKLENVVRRDIRWGMDREYSTMRSEKSVQTFGHAGTYAVTMRIWLSDGSYLTETRNVTVVDDEWQVILSIEPNPANEGQSVVVNDLSVVPPGGQVVERQICWYPSRVYNPMPGDKVHRTFYRPGAYKAIIRLLDANGEYHYGQAGVKVSHSHCVTPVLELSAHDIQVGQAVWFRENSLTDGTCAVEEVEYRRSPGEKFVKMEGREALVPFTEEGVFQPELRVTCKHGFKKIVSSEIRVSNEVLIADNEDFEAKQLALDIADNGAKIELVYAVQQKSDSKLEVKSFDVTYFSIGGNRAIPFTEDGEKRFRFILSPGGVHEVVIEVRYILRNGHRGACQVFSKPIEVIPVVK
ncbi:MAG: hypothetical protein IKP00_02895 [Victivallales bacterium]|nr:hypothetical protein [Victivallales bacterium]